MEPRILFDAEGVCIVPECIAFLVKIDIDIAAEYTATPLTKVWNCPNLCGKCGIILGQKVYILKVCLRLIFNPVQVSKSKRNLNIDS